MIIEELEVPAVATADWIAMVSVRNAVKAEAVGTPHRAHGRLSLVRIQKERQQILVGRNARNSEALD